jgi:hypothetical protein
MLKSVKLTFDALMTCVVWSSVLAMVLLVALTPFRIFLAGGLTAYHLVHP